MRGCHTLPTHRYNGPARQRILAATNQNWLSGFHQGRQGLAFHNGWVENEVGQITGDHWLLSTDTVRMYRANGTIVKSGNNNFNDMVTSKWTINAGSHANENERSDWACAAMLHYNRDLSLVEIQLVESWLASMYGVAGGCH